MRITEAQLKALAARKLTKKTLAERLGVSHAYLCRMTPKLTPGPIRAQRLQTQKLFETRKAFRMKLSKQVAKGRRGLESAAKEANCSIRTIYRYVCKVKECESKK